MDFKKKKREDLFPSYPYANQLLPPSTQQTPPITQYEYKTLIVDFLLKNIHMLPLDTLSLVRHVKKIYRNFDFSAFIIKQLNINEIIKEMLSMEIITCDEMDINLKTCFMIKTVNIEKLNGYKIHLMNSNNNSTSKSTNDIDNYQEKAKTMLLNYIKDCSNNKTYSHDLFINPYSMIPLQKDLLTKKRHRAIQLLLSNTNETQVQNSQLNETQNTNEINESFYNGDEHQAFLNNVYYAPSAKVMLSTDRYADAQDILSQGNTDLKLVSEKIRKKYSLSTKPFCEYGTRAECEKKKKGECHNVHFKPIIKPHTEVSLGDCSYLDTCRHMDLCKFVHYQIEDNETIPSHRKELVLSGDANSLDSQWIECDIRQFDCSVLGKFDVIMADPPWDIHMELPYGTLSDDEMKNLPVKNLQDDGVIFLWVTGRATELARECLELWGYERKEELVWIKTNQLQRLIRTGRTGHWLNHSKEHCLIGIKGNPKLNRNVDCDVLVSEVRETSRKPDEIYELIERMKPGGRKLELFARAHNRRKGWISLGNQLPGTYFVEQEIIDRFNVVYPNEKLTKELMEQNKERSTMLKNVNN